MQHGSGDSVDVAGDQRVRHTIAGPHLQARISADGAELCALKDMNGRQYVWPAAPPWPRHAPILFPIVGRLNDDKLVHNGIAYPMSQHGFARDRRFEWIERSAAACRLALSDDESTRCRYPFRFCLEVGYRIVGTCLAISFRVTNTGDVTLPTSMGAHPAFIWPLREGIAKDAHTLTFQHAETAPLRGVKNGLLTEANRHNPIVGNCLALSPALFADDALIMEHPASTWVRFAAPDGPAITVSWHGFAQLGLWSRPDADFLCIEPWNGMASPIDFGGEFSTKPWLTLVPPGEHVDAEYQIQISPYGNRD